MSNLVAYAKVEFKAAGYEPLPENGKGFLAWLKRQFSKKVEGDPNQWIQENVLELLEIFSKQGHSGSSAPYCTKYFEKLSRFEPLCPLTGKDWEWLDVSDFGGRDDGPLFQNKRCSHVFKDGNGAYDMDGKIFREPDGSCYTSGDSKVSINFPYTPKREYVDVSKKPNETT